MDLDDIDWSILDELQNDGRVGFRELGRRVGLSAPAVTARVRRLEESGVITGYRAVVDTAAVGLPVQAFVRMSVLGQPGRDDEFVEYAETVPEILAMYRVTGAETYLLRVAVPSVAELERVLRPLWQYGDTVTGVVMSVPVVHRVVSRSAPP